MTINRVFSVRGFSGLVLLIGAAALAGIFDPYGPGFRVVP